jgi:DNA-binding beta-propeller fold protein YncE
LITLRTGSSLRTIAVLVLGALTLAGAASKSQRLHLATATIVLSRWPYLPGSLLPLQVEGITPPYSVSILGPGRLLDGNTYEVPITSRGGRALLAVGNEGGLGATHLRIAAPPASNRPLLLVASYDDGLVVHDERNFSVVGVLATGGVPSDVAVDRRGRIAVTDTQGTELTLASLSPWTVARAGGVVTGDEVAIDETTHAVFVTDRDWNGTGALTRVGLDSSVTRVSTGETAEGLAVDERRQIIYVANTNDGTIAFVDARSMRVVRRFPAVARVFSLALSPDGGRLFAISNQGTDSPFGKAGEAIEISLDGPFPRIVARSGKLSFPLGVALDGRTNTLFVGDEDRGAINVLDARTLRPKRAALTTCAIPWKLTLDSVSERLYVPCAGDNEIDVFDARSLRRVAHAPFPTGAYPLAIAVWRP